MLGNSTRMSNPAVIAERVVSEETSNDVSFVQVLPNETIGELLSAQPAVLGAGVLHSPQQTLG